ncbi:14543_t:CDS:1, partial [Cetraspora pellucida]
QVEDNIEKGQYSNEIELIRANSEQAIPQHLRKLRGGGGIIGAAIGCFCCISIIIAVIILPLYYTGQIGKDALKYTP